MNNTTTKAKVLREVDYILQNLPYEIKNKVPSNFKKSIVDNMDINYIPELLDKSKPLDEQKISEETKKILALIYRNYIVSEEERKQLIIEENKIVQELENEKRKKYNYEEIFKNKQKSSTLSLTEGNAEELKIAEYKDKKWYKKIFAIFYRIFRIN